MDQIFAKLHYHLSDDDQHSLPSDVLCKLVDAVNMLTYLTASGLGAEEGMPFADYADFKKNYIVSCAAPLPGSFILPLTIGKVSQFAKIDPAKIAAALFTTLVALNGGTLEGTPISGLSVDNRARFSYQLQRMIPEAGSGCTLSLELVGDEEKTIEISSELLKNASLSLAPEGDVQQENDVSSIIGLVSCVNFDTRELTLKVPYCGKEISCSYGQGTPLSVLFDGRKNRLQVLGNFVFDEEGDPVECTSVTSISPVDLSPIIIKFFGKQLVFTPSLDEDTQQLYVIEEPRYGIDVFADNRSELYELAREQLAANIKHYVRSDSTKLCDEVIKIKNNFIDFFGSEIANESMVG